MEFTTKLAILGIYTGMIIINTGFIAYSLNEILVEKNKGAYILIIPNIILLLQTMTRIIKL